MRRAALADSECRGARLLVASGPGEICYRGVVELGLDRDGLWETLAKLEQTDCPLAWRRPPCAVTWVAPELDVEVHCHGRHGALRDAVLRAVCPPALAHLQRRLVTVHGALLSVAPHPPAGDIVARYRASDRTGARWRPDMRNASSWIATDGDVSSP